MLSADRGTGMLDTNLQQLAHSALSRPLTGYREIGPYRIERVLGEGGVGTVFLATRDDLRSQAAIKVLRDAWISPARRQRFAEEQRTLAQLRHANIAQLFDAGVLPDGTPYFVMEYVDGIPLDQFCEQNNCTFAERVNIFRLVCEAVQFAHSHAVIHRDLKPSNILVCSNGSVKLLDFGISKQMDRLDERAEATRTGLRMMTPNYASPEQMRGESAVVQSDVYSLGVVLYKMLTGQLPFDHSEVLVSKAASVWDQSGPVKPSLVVKRAGHQLSRRGISPSSISSAWADLDVLCLTAMHNDTRKRYQSAEALLRDVDHHLRNEPLEARRDSLFYRTGKFIRRHKGPVAATFAALAIGLGMLGYFTIRVTEERNAALRKAARTRRIQMFMMSLFQGGDKEEGPANDLRVSALIDRGVREARALDQDRAVQAELYQTLGEISQKLGNLDQADGLLQTALSQRRLPAGGNTADLSGSLIALGVLRLDQAKLEAAESLVREGLEKGKAALPPGHTAIAAGYHALGRVLEEKGEYQQAIPILQEAVRLRSGPTTSSGDLASSLFELANVYFYTGKYKESETLNTQVLSMTRRLYGDRHPKVAEALSSLGAIQHDTGHYREAEKFHRQALELTEAFYGTLHYRTASSLTLLARALVYQKRYDEAVQLLNRAIAIQEKTFGLTHPRVASALNEFGNVAVLRGRYDEAKVAFRRMALIYRTVYPGGHYLIGTATANLGSVYLAQKEYAAAEVLFRKAVVNYTQTLSPDHLNTAIARIKLGRTLLRQKRYLEAETEVGAGYRILNEQVSPAASWIKNARTDLAEISAALGRPPPQ